MGSVLKKDGGKLWSMPSILGPALLGRSATFEPLYLRQDDPELETLPDGIRATGLMTGIHGIHGLMLGEGYRQICDAISRAFDVVSGTVETDGPVNFIPFPYDWRRDNRVAAHRLKRLIERKLPQWQEYMRDPNVRVILIGHSMGGLVARYYLEVLGGWERCRALITLGTPHRGSLNALETLCVGYWLGFANLTDLVCSFTSVYQLLPTYQAVWEAGQLRRVAEMDDLPGLSRANVVAAQEFHDEIRQAIRRRETGRAYPIFPIVGTHQPTYQSAVRTGRWIELSYSLPKPPPMSQYTAWISEGDGTVPSLSAIPIECSEDYRDTFYAERHAWLPSNHRVLDKLRELLTRMQLAGYLDSYQGGLPPPADPQAPALRLNLTTVFRVGETIHPHVQIVNQQEEPVQVTCSLATPDNNIVYERQLDYDGKDWQVKITDIEPGLYSLTVATYKRGPLAPQPVHDILEVVA
jgi:hypothetical protein